VPLTKPSSLQPPPPAAQAAAAARREPAVICFSARHAGGMPSLTLRRNGTGSFSWPSGALAASADLDAAGGYRLMAMYQGEGIAASVALSADANGGFAQYPSGRAALTWRRGDAGSHSGADGRLLASWSKRGPRLRQDVRQELGQGLSVTYSAATGDCVLRLDMGTFHPELECLLLSRNTGAALVYAKTGGAVVPPLQLAATSTAASATAPDPKATAAAAPKRSNSHQRPRQAAPRPEDAAPQPAVFVQPRPAPEPQSGGGLTGDGSNAVDAALGGGSDLASVIRRAQALMARSAAAEQEEADARRQAAGDAAAAGG
jgi:hypothetical protein